MTNIDQALESEDSWMLLDLLDQAAGFAALSQTLGDLVDEGYPVVALTGDLKYSNGLVRFEERYPDRFFNMGISEQNMVSAAAGMATCGLIPFVGEFASFLALLCCEQIRTDVAYSQLPVRLIGHHAGITLGFYGTSHHATEDMAIMRAIAGITVIAPADAGMLAKAIRCSMEWPEPIYFRIGRGREPDVYDESALVDYQIGKAIVHRLGTEATIIATGSTVAQSIQAVETLAKEGHDIGIVDMHTIKPLDTDAICQAAAACPLLITVEEHNVIGGLGGAVAETVTTLGLNVRVHRHGIPDTYSLIGPPTHLYQHYKLDADGIVDTVIALIEGR